MDITQTEEGLIVVIPADTLFSEKSVALRQSAKQVIQKIARYLNKTDYNLRIESHTDSSPVRSGRYRNNLELSLGRAHRILNEILEMKVNPMRLSLVGKGDSQPKASNETGPGRRLNRRIEIVILTEM